GRSGRTKWGSATRGGRRLRADDAALRALAGPRVGVGPLATHRQALAVTQAAVAAQVHQSLDVHGHLATEVTLDLVLALDDLAQGPRLVPGEVLGGRDRIDPGLADDVLGGLATDSVDVRQGDDRALPGRQVDASDTSHGVACPCLRVRGSPSEGNDQPW